MRKTLVLAGFALLLAGCESFVAQGYISPRVTGRVLDATNREPLAYVSVRRLNNTDDRGSFSSMPPRGGEMLMAADTVRTGRDGRFMLAPEQVALGFVSTLAVQLEVRCSGYLTLITNLPPSLITNTFAKGPPVMNAGDILLERAKP